MDNDWTYASRPKSVVKGAHPPGESVTSLAFARDGNTLISRCVDGTLRVWDLRRVAAPLKTFHDLETTHEVGGGRGWGFPLPDAHDSWTW